jgi:hypothetical protein
LQGRPPWRPFCNSGSLVIFDAIRRALNAPCRAYEENGEGGFTSDLSGSMFDFFFSIGSIGEKTWSRILALMNDLNDLGSPDDREIDSILASLDDSCD